MFDPLLFDIQDVCMANEALECLFLGIKHFLGWLHGPFWVICGQEGDMGLVLSCALTNRPGCIISWEGSEISAQMQMQMRCRYEQEEHAAEAYDVAALKTKKDGNQRVMIVSNGGVQHSSGIFGVAALKPNKYGYVHDFDFACAAHSLMQLKTNFDVERYQDLSGCMHTISLEELIMAVRRQSQGHISFMLLLLESDKAKKVIKAAALSSSNKIADTDLDAWKILHSVYPVKHSKDKQHACHVLLTGPLSGILFIPWCHLTP
eukprot:scaffold254050_cov21-Tisochrysis_lutea.AAC.1